MSSGRLDLVFLGLSLSSSWGNGHATTYRALLRGLGGTRPSRAVPGTRCALVRRGARSAAAGFLRAGALPAISPSCAARFGARDRRGRCRHRRLLCAGWHRGPRLRGRRRAAAYARSTTSIRRSPWRRWNAATADYLAATQIAGVRSLSLLHRRTDCSAHLARRFGARRPRALYCAVDETLYRPQAMLPRWDLGYLGTYSA